MHHGADVQRLSTFKVVICIASAASLAANNFFFYNYFAIDGGEPRLLLSTQDSFAS